MALTQGSRESQGRGSSVGLAIPNKEAVAPKEIVADLSKDRGTKSPDNHERITEMNIPDEAYRRIEELIANDQSPVGIDAKRTHVMVLHQLERIERRLEKIEKSLGG